MLRVGIRQPGHQSTVVGTSCATGANRTGRRKSEAGKNRMAYVPTHVLFNAPAFGGRCEGPAGTAEAC